mmetsp:Transcript_27434/g.57101  ORF Transcript_27434/g.57101 Transcript_27434/m.57101 type:complete len:83 (-) Transcript_27434:130-378(-)
MSTTTDSNDGGDDDNDDDANNGRDGGFSGGRVDAANDDGVQAKLIYAAYQGTTLPVSEASMVSGEETIAAIVLSTKKQIECP